LNTSDLFCVICAFLWPFQISGIKSIDDTDMADKVFRVLFLCTGNSARSILGESLLNHWGAERVVGYSAGSQPKAQPHPLAIELLKARGMPTDGLRSKSWDEFAKRDSLPMNLVITVCDNAAKEACPIFPGAAVKVHWGIPDAAAVSGSIDDQRAAFMKAYRTLENRIAMLVDLPLASLSATELKRRVEQLAS
jgi:arsenate reductase